MEEIFADDPFQNSVQGQYYSSSGEAHGPQFLVNSYTTANQFGSTVAAGPNNAFVVVFSSYGSSGTDDGSGSALGRRFRGLLFADGFESGDSSAWSATLP